MTNNPTLQNNTDNYITVFQLDGQPVRGRALYINDALDKAVGDRYPEVVARLLSEAMMIGALVVQSLKFTGRLIVQCHGTNEGAVSLLMADCTTDGTIRGYARWDEQSLKEILLDNRNPGADTLLGRGTFSMTIDQGSDMDQYQGLAAIHGKSLSDCAEHYFAQSEQIPTKIRIACGQSVGKGVTQWHGGGMIIQKIADDELRGDTLNAWETAQSLFATLSDDELIDPSISSERLLFRLFHESGIRIVETSIVEAKCTCSKARLQNTLASFDKEALNDMAENGRISANCEFCGSEYVFTLAQIT